MTNSEIEKINKLQIAGFGYRKIASELGLSANTVKSYCKRHPIADDVSRCKQCDIPLEQIPHKRRKEFCSKECRLLWWKQHPEESKRKYYSRICNFCGQSFYGQRPTTMYCSRKCYADARRKEERK